MLRYVVLALFSALILSISGVSPILGGKLEAPTFVQPNPSVEASQNTAEVEPVSENLSEETRPTAVTPIKACQPASRAVARATASTNNPGYHENTDEAFYQINGSSVDDLYTQMNTCGPLIAGKRYAASTNYSLAWAYKVTVSDGLCSLSGVSVSLNQLYTLPSWDKTSGSSSTVARWDSFVSNLRIHENGHGQTNKQYAHNLYDSLLSMKDLNCGNIAAQASSTANNIANSMKAANSSYDQTTDHGVTQNAVL